VRNTVAITPNASGISSARQPTVISSSPYTASARRSRVPTAAPTSEPIPRPAKNADTVVTIASVVSPKIRTRSCVHTT
jgi:hypothetical protein